MANITISEISQNYSYNIGSSSFAQVALPITSCWGPGFYDPNAYGMTKEDMLEGTTWKAFPATQVGLEAFVATYRGPASNYRTFEDYSYQMAMSLLSAGYDVLVCRMCPGTPAQTIFQIDDDATVVVKAKYPGTFGNSLQVVLMKVHNALVPYDYWNIITYIVDASGVKTAVDNKVFVFDIENSTSNIPYVRELDSEFIEFGAITGDVSEQTVYSYSGVGQMLQGGTDIVPMVTSEEYDEAYAKQIELSGKLVDMTADVAYYEERVANCEAHISKLDADIKAYNNKKDAAEKEEPVDTDLVAELTSRISDLTEQKTKWETDLETEESNLTTAQETLKSTKADIASEKEIVKSESVKFRTTMVESALASAKVRYGVSETATDLSYPEYIIAIANLDVRTLDNAFCLKLMNQEWVFSSVIDVYDLLKDKLSYKPNRIISPGWDDQNISEITLEPVKRLNQISPLHLKLMDVAYYSRCATSLIDVPRCLPRAAVYNESTKDSEIGYAQMLARVVPNNANNDVNGSLYHSHSAFFAPWGTYTYVGMLKQVTCSPSFAALIIQRAMIRNQSSQYEWALPESRQHNVKLGKLDYTVPKKLLDVWQRTEGVGVNVIADIPDMGLSLWGNSTLYEVPPATYQALANLSTRYLVNAVEDVIYKCGINITFKYNNQDAYSSFYAGVTPILELMKNQGAIDGFMVEMSADINGLDAVNANTVIGKVTLYVMGVINDIKIDLIAMPPQTGTTL